MKRMRFCRTWYRRGHEESLHCCCFCVPRGHTLLTQCCMRKQSKRLGRAFRLCRAILSKYFTKRGSAEQYRSCQAWNNRCTMMMFKIDATSSVSRCSYLRWNYTLSRWSQGLHPDQGLIHASRLQRAHWPKPSTVHCRAFKKTFEPLWWREEQQSSISITRPLLVIKAPKYRLSNQKRRKRPRKMGQAQVSWHLQGRITGAMWEGRHNHLQGVNQKNYAWLITILDAAKAWQAIEKICMPKAKQGQTSRRNRTRTRLWVIPHAQSSTLWVPRLRRKTSQYSSSTGRQLISLTHTSECKCT